MRIMLPVALLLAFLPAAASALTVQEVVALSKAGVSDEVLLTLIERDKTIFAIDSDQLIALTRDRVSEKLVLAMLRSGREEPPPSPVASANATHAAPADPGALMFGHGPSRPNTYHQFDLLGLVAPPSVVYAVPYFAAPFAVPSARSAVTCQPTTSASRTDRTTGIAEASGKFVNNALLPALAAAGGGETVCQPTPAPLPPSRSVRRPRR
jgi:hypothetical protein